MAVCVAIVGVLIVAEQRMDVNTRTQGDGRLG